MGLPEIIINFVQKASTAIERSEKGIVCLLLDDTTAEGSVYAYELLSQVNEEEWTADSYKVIRDTMLAGPSKVFVVRVGSDQSFTDVEATVDSLKFNWLTYTNADAQADIVEYVKARNELAKGRKIKAVVFNQAADDIHIVSLINTSVKRAEDDTEIAGNLYLGRIAGVLAALPFTRSSTYYELTDLESVAEPEDINAAIDGGSLVLINDYGEPKIGRGVNTLQKLGDNQTDDWKSIAIIEAMDMMLEDIYTTFKESYVGRYKNSYQNQCIFLSAVNQYFSQLSKEDVLDPEYDNHSEIDIEAQRSAWLTAGTEEATSWNELTVKKNTFKKKLFLAGKVKILDAMEDMVFNIGITV